MAIDPLVQGAIFLAIAGVWSVFVAKVLGPWAWARAVDNPKSKASKVLTATLDATVKKIAESVKVPTLSEIEAKMPKLEGLSLSVDLRDQFKTQEFQDAMQMALKSAWAKRVLGKEKEQSGGALEEALQDAEWVSANAEQAQYLGMAHQMIDGPLATVMNWDDKKKKLLHQQAIDYAKQGADLKEWMEKLSGGLILNQGGVVSRGGGGPV